MAPPGENGSGPSRPERVPRFVSVSSGRFVPGIADGPLAVAAAPLRTPRLPQPPPDGLPELPDAARRDGPQPAAASRRTLEPPPPPSGERRRDASDARSEDHVDSRIKAQGERARREHHQGAADGVKFLGDAFVCVRVSGCTYS